MLGDVITKSIIKTFSNNLFINISSSLMTYKLNLVNNVLSGLAPIKFS